MGQSGTTILTSNFLILKNYSVRILGWDFFYPTLSHYFALGNNHTEFCSDRAYCAPPPGQGVESLTLRACACEFNTISFRRVLFRAGHGKKIQC